MTRQNRTIPKALLEAIEKNTAVRRELAKSRHDLFVSLYLPHYIKHPLARFHQEILTLTEDESVRLAVIMAFRGSGKSTYVTLSYALWGIIGIQRRKNVLILSRTQAQAHNLMANIRREVEGNEWLKEDLGPFREDNGGEWGASSIVFKDYDARITAASIDQAIRGIRHGEHRPDLIIGDDLEDITSVRTKESRDKTFDSFMREVVPLGGERTRIFVVGNCLHEDGLMMRLKGLIDSGQMDGTFRRYPFLDAKGCPLWKEKYDSPEKVAGERRKHTELSWQWEMLLNVVSDDSRVIDPSAIKRYKELPKELPSAIFVGVDPAFSLNDSADNTAMVAIAVYGYGDELTGYLLPNAVNRKMSPYESATVARELHNALLSYGVIPAFIVEGNGAQAMLADYFKSAGCSDVRTVTNSRDKRFRLSLVAHLVQSGAILFPETGAEDVVMQITGLGVERHDDAADAFTIAAGMVLEMHSTPPFQIWVG